MLMALTREITSALCHCEITCIAREPINMQRARAEHRAYEQCLESLGCMVRRISAEPAQADSVFIEDCAVVLEELAIITRPGAESRRAETTGVEQALRDYRPIGRIEPPGTMDGGDVMRVGQRLFVGRSSRTNEAGIEQLRSMVQPFGYEVIAVSVHGCLHLKSAVCLIGDDLLLANRAWVDLTAFGTLRALEVHPSEPHAANALRVGDAVVHSAGYPRTAERMIERGLHVVPVIATEIAKAEGAVSCCSLLFGQT